MEEPFRFFKKLVKLGNSVGVVLPTIWFKFRGNSKIKEIVVEVYSNKIVLSPMKKRK